MLPYILPEDHRLVSVDPKTLYRDGQRTDEQDTRGGVPLWSVMVKVLFTDADGDPTSDRLKVTVPSRGAPKITAGGRVNFEGLSVGSSPGGCYFQAAGVEEADPLSDVLDDES